MKILRTMLLVMVLMGLGAAMAAAQTEVAIVVDYNATGFWVKLLSAGLCIALAAIGCATAMGKALVAAYESYARNPSVGKTMMTMMILGLALIEALAIYSLVIAIMILGQ